jgi:hypothetical protein
MRIKREISGNKAPEYFSPKAIVKKKHRTHPERVSRMLGTEHEFSTVQTCAGVA